MVIDNTYDFTFTQAETRKFIDSVFDVKANPYTDYDSFCNSVNQIAEYCPSLERFRDFCSLSLGRNTYEQPCVKMAQCPIDIELPALDVANPVVDKRNRKATFVSEAFFMLMHI